MHLLDRKLSAGVWICRGYYDTKGKLLFNTFKLTCESQFHQSSDMVQNIWTSVILNLIFPHYQSHVISYCCYCVQKYGKLKDTVGLIDVASDCELQVTVMGFMNIHDITTCFDRRWVLQVAKETLVIWSTHLLYYCTQRK